MRRLSIIGICLSLCAGPLTAQDFPRFEVFGGYSHSSFSDGFVKRVPGNGWNAAVQYNFDKAIGLKTDFSGTYGTDDVAAGQPFKVKNYTYTFGPVFAVRANRRFTPFAELLSGGYHETRERFPSSLTGFAVIAVGGVDVKVAEHWAVRAGPVDWLHMGAPSSTTSFQTNNVRVSAGLVYRF